MRDVGHIFCNVSGDKHAYITKFYVRPLIVNQRIVLNYY